MATRKDTLVRRASRVRRQIKAVANGRPRLSVHRSSKNIYAQVIDDVAGKTLASASTLDTDLRSRLAPMQQQLQPSASFSPSALRRLVSRTSSLTVAPSSITAASRRSPRQPAKAV